MVLDQRFPFLTEREDCIQVPRRCPMSISNSSFPLLKFSSSPHPLCLTHFSLYQLKTASSFRLLRPKTLEASLAPLFLPPRSSSLSGYPVDSTFKINSGSTDIILVVATTISSRKPRHSTHPTHTCSLFAT